jgi:DNA-binding NtrC family response regulator
MVYGVIKNHGGTVAIDSRPNRGTKVTFLLPEHAEATLNSEVDSAGDEDAVLGHTAVLLVDDEQIIRRSVGRLLEKLGYVVFMAESGRTALDIFQRKKKEISLVLLDLIMPEMDGTETYEELRKIDPNVCVILSSGYSKDEKVEALLSKGVRGYIQKPFDMHSLSEIIKTTMAQEIKKTKNSD